MAAIFRAVSYNAGIPTQVSGDLILAFSFTQSTTLPTFSADWTSIHTRSAAYSTRIAYKFSNGSSTLGTISNGYLIYTVSGVDATVSTGATPSFLGGAASQYGSYTKSGGSIAVPIPAVGSAADSYLRLTSIFGISDNNNTLFRAIGASGNTDPTGMTRVGWGNDTNYLALTGGDLNSNTFYDNGPLDNVGTAIAATVQILAAKTSGFFSMF